jgi:hypothetical protein
MSELKQILILRYLDDDLSASEKIAFEKSLLLDTELAKELAIYQGIIQGVQIHEKRQLKNNLAKIEASISQNEFKTYEPKQEEAKVKTSIPKAAIIRLIILLSILGFILSFILIFLNKFPIKHPAIDKIHEKLIYYDTLNNHKVDTIYHTITSEHVEKDTILYGEQELLNFMENVDSATFE